MAKWITLAIVAGLFFSVGLFAGHRVSTTVAHAKGVNEKPNSDLTAAPQPATNTPDDSTAGTDAGSISFISHANTSGNAEQRTAELKAESGSTHEHGVAIRNLNRAAIRNLIRQHFPDANKNVADVWIETYSDMSLDDVTFILEQKRHTSGEIGAEFSMPFLSHPVQPDPLPSEPDQAINVAIRMVEANLRSAYSLGFRRTVVLPDAIADLESWTRDKPRSVPMTSFRSFQSGTRISSPIATHVALTEENSTMFCLEGNRLTRRGDFQLLADRRLGIVTSREEIAAVESTPLPDGATDVQILQNGTIQFRNAVGDTSEAGRIAVCRVTNQADLQSIDGIFFIGADTGNITTHEDPSDFLLMKTLEQSNVDRSYENSLLEYLKSLSDPSIEQVPYTIRDKE